MLGQANVDLPKGTLNGPQQSLHAQYQRSAAQARGLQRPDRRLPQRLAGAHPRRRPGHRRAGERSDRRLVQQAARHHSRRSSAQPGANVIETVDRIKALLPQLEASIPPAIKVNVVSDRTQTIRASVSDVQFTLMLTDRARGDGDLRVPAQFLGDHHSRPSPCRSSLIGTFAVLYELGYSLDNLSLMALTIAVGFVVDDAVVVIENIVRHLEEG